MKQHNDNIQSDILPLALMFIIVFYLIFILPTQLLNKNKAYQELLQAKELTIYYYDRANSLEDSVVSLNDYIDNQDSAIISLKSAPSFSTASRFSLSFVTKVSLSFP